MDNHRPPPLDYGTKEKREPLKRDPLWLTAVVLLGLFSALLALGLGLLSLFEFLKRYYE
jgi:hypothetical protein